MDNIRKFQNGLKIEPKTPLTADTQGELEVDSVSGKINYHNGTTESPIVTESHSATLTNKSIDADTNTITNIENADIKAGAAIDATKIADGSVSNTEFQFINSLTSNAQDQIDSKTTGPASATNDAVARFDGTTGKLLDNSLVTVSDAGVMSGATQLNVDNLRLDGNTVSSTDTNGNVVIDPNGTGDIQLTVAGAGATVDIGSTSIQATDAGVLSITGQLNADNLRLDGNTVSSTDTNGNVVIDPNGTGDIQLTVAGAGATVDIGSTSIQATDAGILTITGQLNADNLRLDANTLSSTNTDGNILLDPNGTGFTSIESGPLRTAEQSAPGTPASGFNYLYPKTDGYLYYKNDAGAETKIQSGSGGINYISNSDFEGDTTGWATYADAAATTPVDGTGGSPNITFTRSTSSPLRGTGSGLITKDAANRQGQGVSYDFTIDSADKSRELMIAFDYEASAAYTGSSGTEYMSMFVYDVTNAVVIPSSFLSSSIPQGSGTQHITFNSTTSTSYRLIYHIAGTGTSAWTYKIDTVQVGPQDVVLAPAIGDWTSFTMLIAGSTSNPTKATTPVLDEAQWRRVGDSMEIRYTYIHTSNGGSAAGSGRYLFTIPNSLTIDTTKLSPQATSNGGPVVGAAGGFQTAIGAAHGYVFADSTTQLSIALGNDTNTPQQVGSAYAPLNGAVVKYSFEAIVPITTWSSNIQLANSRVEYASNSGMGDAADTTSFVNDPNGSAIPQVTYTASRNKRIRFKNPVQASDSLVVQIKNQFGAWIDFSTLNDTSGIAYQATQLQNGVTYGFGRLDNISTTDFDIQFGQYRLNNSTYGAAGSNWTTDTATRWRVVKYSNAVPVESSSNGVVTLSDQKANGTAGGTFTSGSFQTRVLNTVEGDTSLVSLSSNQFTLQPGVYEILARAPAYNGANGHVCRIQNITDSVQEFLGSNARAEGTGTQSDSFAMGRLRVTKQTTYELQHRCQTTATTTGFGQVSGTSQVEVYAQVKISKVG